MDKRLLALSESAERGESCPVLNVLSGSWLISGSPCTTRKFMEATHANFYQQVVNTTELRRYKNEEQHLRHDILKQTNPMMTTFDQGPHEPEEAISLLNATVVASTGPALKVPALRVQLGSVGSWWVTDFRADQEFSYVGGVGVGFTF